MRDAVGDLVELIKVYQSKGRISQVMMSTLFKRRQEEAGVVINAAVSRLHVRRNLCRYQNIDPANGQRWGYRGFGYLAGRSRYVYLVFDVERFDGTTTNKGRVMHLS